MHPEETGPARRLTLPMKESADLWRNLLKVRLARVEEVLSECLESLNWLAGEWGVGYFSVVFTHLWKDKTFHFTETNLVRHYL